MDFVGRGLAFPVHTDATGSIALVGGEREIVESIRLILATAPGERPMRPEFGCAIHDLVFAPADAATAGRIAYEVRASLERWEPRITLTDVVVSFSEADRGTLLIDVHYTLRADNDPRNLVFPFYVIPPHDAADSPKGAGTASDRATRRAGPEQGGPREGGPRRGGSGGHTEAGGA